MPCFFILRFFKKILDNRTKGGLQYRQEVVKDVKTIKLTDQCKCYQFLGCEKGKAQAIYLHKTSDVFFRLIPDIEDIITIIEQEYSELSKAYQEKEKIYSSNPSIENKFEVEKAESAYITIAYLKDKLMF